MTHGTGLLLLSAVAGYWVLERSAAHKGQLKNVGQLIGWVVIVISLVGMACKIFALTTGKTIARVNLAALVGYEYGALAALYRLAGMVRGLVGGLAIPVANGHFAPRRRKQTATRDA
jgi:hypothetical protein